MHSLLHTRLFLCVDSCFFALAVGLAASAVGRTRITKACDYR